MSRNVFAPHGASNHSTGEREENDYYATHQSHVKELLSLETFNRKILEPAVGEGHIAKELVKNNHKVVGLDIIDRGYENTRVKDFLKTKFKKPIDYDIITNPPYKFAKEFVEKSMDIIKEGNKVAMFLKLTFLESQKRYEMFQKYPPKYIYISIVDVLYVVRMETLSQHHLAQLHTVGLYGLKDIKMNLGLGGLND